MTLSSENLLHRRNVYFHAIVTFVLRYYMGSRGSLIKLEKKKIFTFPLLHTFEN